MGMFNGPVKTEWLPNGRDMVVTTQLTYIDNSGKAWNAWAGSTVNGASIPKPLWTFIGSPFCGKYRRASVIHDVYCGTHSEPWQSAHRVFYEMMDTDGVGMMQRWLMFRAVWFFGPRWEQQTALEK